MRGRRIIPFFNKFNNRSYKTASYQIELNEYINLTIEGVLKETFSKHHTLQSITIKLVNTRIPQNPYKNVYTVNKYKSRSTQNKADWQYTRALDNMEKIAKIIRKQWMIILK